MSEMSESPCAGCITRRGFLGQSATLAALAALAAACGEPTSPGKKFEPITFKVADFPALTALNVFVTPDFNRAVKRTGTGTFAAFSLSCTHEGTTVGFADNSTTFLCPNHLSRFGNDGQVTEGPASSPLVSLTTTYDSATDMLTVGGTT